MINRNSKIQRKSVGYNQRSFLNDHAQGGKKSLSVTITDETYTIDLMEIRVKIDLTSQPNSSFEKCQKVS